MAAGSTAGPSRFYYVLPFDLVPLEAVPSWAGLWLVKMHEGTPHVWLKQERQAPRLHRTVVKESIIRHALGVCYYRYWSEREHRDYQSLPTGKEVPDEVAPVMGDTGSARATWTAEPFSNT